MKKLALISCLLILLLPLFGMYRENFLSSAIAVNANTVKVHGTDFTSGSVWVAMNESKTSAAIVVTFTRSAGTADTVDFYFQTSIDGTNWDSDYTLKIAVPTNTPAVSNVVITTTFVNKPGVTHWRLSKIDNNDTANNLTAVNATMSF